MQLGGFLICTKIRHRILETLKLMEVQHALYVRFATKYFYV